MGFLACPPSYRESLSASPHGARNPVTLDLKARTVRNQKTRVEWALMCSRGWCAVDASLVLSLVSHFSQRGAFGYSAAYGLPACTLFRGYGLIARALPQAALGLFIPLRTSPGQQTLCPAVRQLSRPLALLPAVRGQEPLFPPSPLACSLPRTSRQRRLQSAAWDNPTGA